MSELFLLVSCREGFAYKAVAPLFTLILWFCFLLGSGPQLSPVVQAGLERLFHTDLLQTGLLCYEHGSSNFHLGQA